MKPRKGLKLARLPKSETDYIWVSPGMELAKRGEYIPGEGVCIRGKKLYAKSFGFVNIDKNKVIRVIPLAGG